MRRMRMKTLTDKQKEILEHNVKLEIDIQRFCTAYERKDKPVKLRVIRCI